MKDDAIRDAIVAELRRIGSATGVVVSVRDAVAVLSGAGPDPMKAFAAEAATCRMTGVRALINRLGLEGAPGRDEATARSALAALAAMPTPSRTLRPMRPGGGVVTLHGEVPEDRWRTVVEQELLQLAEVGDVRNLLHVALPVGDACTRLMALMRRERVVIEDLALEVVDGAVTLRGRAPGWFDRDAVERLTWTLPGVTSVANRITLPPDAVAPSAAKGDDL